MRFVLDASVALSWLLEDAGADQAYASHVFAALGDVHGEARVPSTWALEIANVVAKAENRNELPRKRSEAFLEVLGVAPIVCDPDTAAKALAETLELARRYRLSSYDASYLELAVRSALPLATLDSDLKKAAGKAGVKLFKPT